MEKVKTIDDLINFIQEECMDGMTEPKYILDAVFDLKEQMSSFEGCSRILIKYINENYHPHTTVIITPTSAELMSSEKVITKIYDYIID